MNSGLAKLKEGFGAKVQHLYELLKDNNDLSSALKDKGVDMRTHRNFIKTVPSSD